MQQLNNSEFTCEKCANVFKYEVRKKHWESCGAEFKCLIEGCANAGTSFADFEKLNEHWNSNCNVIELQCTLCEATLKREGIDSHRCEVNFMF